MQVWPVMCAGGVGIKSPGVTPSLQLSINLQTSDPTSASSSTAGTSSGHSPPRRPISAPTGSSSGGSPATAVADIKLRPSTVWLNLPLLQRLQAFLEPLTNPVVQNSEAAAHGYDFLQLIRPSNVPYRIYIWSFN